MLFYCKQDRQCTYNVRLERVRESFLPWKSNKYYVFACVCVCVCVCARARARVRGWVGSCVFQIKVVEKIKILILCPTTFSENRAVYEIMSKIWWSQTSRKRQHGGALHAGLVRLHSHKHTLEPATAPAPVHLLPPPNTRARARKHTEACNTYCFYKATAVS